MISYQEKQQVAQEGLVLGKPKAVAVEDIDTHLDGRHRFRVCWLMADGTTQWETADFADFVSGWLYQREIDDYSERGAGLITIFPQEEYCPMRGDCYQMASGTRNYTFQEYLGEFSSEIEPQLVNWKNSRA